MTPKLPDPTYVEKLLSAVEKHPHGMLLLIVAGMVAIGLVWAWKH